MDREAVRHWIADYERAWRTAGTDGLGELFTEDALYRMSPYQDAFRGLDQIAEMWERERQGPDEEFDMTSDVIAVEGDRAVAFVEVHYGRGTEYRDLWVMRFGPDGRVSEFEEWPFGPSGQ
jgi:uncharacterized protein (TIGR02246 family)